MVPIFTQLMNDGVVTSGIFAFYFDHHYLHEGGNIIDIKDASVGGELSLGGVNRDRFMGTYPDSFQWHPVSQKAFWQISLDTVKTNGVEFCENDCQG